MNWSTACPDWERRILAGESLIPFPPLFPAEAEAALAIFRDLVLVDVAGEPTAGEACRQWVFDFVAAVFGAYDAETGRRLIRNFFLCVSKKNAKSTIAAGIMLVALLRNWRRSAEYLILAPTVEAAGNCYKPARDMIAASEDLSAIFQVQDHIRTITHIKTGATLKVVAADSATVTGKKATGVLVDELWEFGKRADAEDMLREATGGLASRTEGFVIYLTTQSDQPPAGVFKQRLDYFRRVRDGQIEDRRSLPVIYEFPPALVEAKAYRDPAKFYVTNPNLGKSVDVEFLSDEFRKAEHQGDAALRGFMAKHLNLEMGGAMLGAGWSGARHWDAAASPGLTLDELLARCEVATVGVDAGGSDDLCGIAVLGRVRGERRYLLWAHAVCAPGAVAGRPEIAPRLKDFSADGDLTVTERPGQDTQIIAGIVQRVREAGLLPEKMAVGLDNHRLHAALDALEEAGVPSAICHSIPQGFRLSGAIDWLDRKLAEGALQHSGSAMLAWCVGNARVEMRGNGISIEKATAGSGKIDALVAAINAAELMAHNPAGVGQSFWEAA